MSGSESVGGPKPGDLEVTLIGPGYGESCLIHLPNGNWIVIDSCVVSPSKTSAALEYLESIKVDVAVSVKSIIITHFHDDHIKGSFSLIEACTSAEIVMSSAMSQTEFAQYVTRYKSQKLAAGSGVGEISRILEHARDTGRHLKSAVADRLILRIPATGGISPECNVWTLSPSDGEISKFLANIGLMLPQHGQTKGRAVPGKPNDTSVVTFVEVGDIGILLGADLEQRGSSDLGWKAVVNSGTRPQLKAAVYKVAHHGSKTGHNNDVWENMLHENPYAILTPWTRGGKGLPNDSDVSRIKGLTVNGFITSSRTNPKTKVARPAAVEKTIREQGVTLRHAQPGSGRICLRRNSSGGPNLDWEVILSARAAAL